MPVITNLRPASFMLETESSTTSITAPLMVGVEKSISNLNNSKPFVPGLYTCNPVSISTTTALSEATSVPKWKSGPYYVTGSGDSAAYAANQLLYAPKGINFRPTLWSDGRAQEALSKAYAKIMEPDLTLGVTLGELGETLEGLRSPLSALRKMVKDLAVGNAKAKRKRFDTLRKGLAVADGATGTWLEYRYGIAPLISEVQSILEFIRAATRRFDTNLQSKRSKAAEVSDLISTGYCYADVAGHRIVHEYVCTQVDWYNCSVSYNFTRPWTLDEVLGVSVLDIPGIIWETTTLSFVLDWFVRVGDFLESLKPVLSSAVNLQGASVTRRIRLAFTARALHILIAGVVKSPVVGGFYSLTLESMERRCLGAAFPQWVPSLNTQTLSLAKQLDSIALAWQPLSNKSRDLLAKRR